MHVPTEIFHARMVEISFTVLQPYDLSFPHPSLPTYLSLAPGYTYPCGELWISSSLPSQI